MKEMQHICAVECLEIDFARGIVTNKFILSNEELLIQHLYKGLHCHQTKINESKTVILFCKQHVRRILKTDVLNNDAFFNSSALKCTVREILLTTV